MKITIAGHIFEYLPRHDYVTRQCRDYLCDGVADCRFEISEEEKRRFGAVVDDGEREYIAIHSRICNYLMDKNILLFHGSCLALDGNGILFTAPSGTGKSTHARLWRERFGNRVTMVNDDKPLLQFNPATGNWTAWGSPWCGKEGINSNTHVPLLSIVVLKQSANNRLQRLLPEETIGEFLPQAYVPSENLALRLKALNLVQNLTKIPVYRLECSISQQAVDLSLHTLI